MTAERTAYHAKTEERAADLLRFFEDKGLHPTMTPPDKPGEHARWIVEIDPAPLLPHTPDTPPANNRHWKRPEYRQSYGHWFSPVKPDFDRCCVEIWNSGRGAAPTQCSHKANSDPDYLGLPTRCKAHSRAAEAARKAKSDAKYRAEREAWNRRDRQERAMRAALALVIKIAAGHNDPRGAAQDLLTEFGLHTPPEKETY